MLDAATASSLSQVNLSFGNVEALMYIGPASSFWLLLGVWVFEWRAMQRAGALAIMSNNPIPFFVAASMGFGATHNLALANRDSTSRFPAVTGLQNQTDAW